MKNFSEIYLESMITEGIDLTIFPLVTNDPLKYKNAGKEGWKVAKDLKKDNKWKKNYCRNIKDLDEKKKCEISYNDMMIKNLESIINFKCKFSKTPQRCYNSILNKISRSMIKRDNLLNYLLNMHI